MRVSSNTKFLCVFASIVVSESLRTNVRARNATLKPIKGAKYSCGKVPLRTIWSVYSPMSLLGGAPSKLRCGDDNSELAGGGEPNEIHFAMCVLSTMEKLSAYTPPLVSDKAISIYEWAKENTDCEVDTTDVFLVVAKPSRDNLLMRLHKACFEYEAGQKRVAPLKDILEAYPLEKVEERNKYVEMIFGMVLGYSKQATFDYLVKNYGMDADRFEEMYTHARTELISRLGDGVLSEDVFETFSLRSSTANTQSLEIRPGTKHSSEDALPVKKVTKYSCGRVPLQTVWEVYSPMEGAPWKLKCGDDNTEVAGGGQPNEAHLAMCVLTTLEKLSAYTPPIGGGEITTVYEWAKDHTDCEVETEGIFSVIAKPSTDNVLMRLHQACFAYEAGQKKVSPLKEILEAYPLEAEEQGRYVEMIFGMVLGYPKHATYDYMVVIGRMDAGRFEELYTQGRREVMNLLGDGVVSEDVFETLSVRSSLNSSPALWKKFQPEKWKIAF